VKYELSVGLEEIIQLYQVGHMPHALSMIPMSIPDPAFVKRKVFLTYDTGNEHQLYL
jgi:hypothetical protein